MTAKKKSASHKGTVASRSSKVAARSTAKTAAPRAPKELTEYRRKRNFSVTAEPVGSRPAPARRKHAFVVQKHDASRLHYDLRLELDGVMKSWAVPKGPSLDPSVKRLAMQVEDHPIEYNTFEGTIPAGEYGGGTVMLWDRGTYSYHGDNPDPNEGLRQAYGAGRLEFDLEGKRLHGRWLLVRTQRGDPEKPQWLFFKRRDEHARTAADADVTEEFQTSVTTGRTMDEIAAGRRRVWRSNREPASPPVATTKSSRAIGRSKAGTRSTPTARSKTTTRSKPAARSKARMGAA